MNVGVYPDDYSVEEEVYMTNLRRKESIVAEVPQSYKKYEKVGRYYFYILTGKVFTSNTAIYLHLPHYELPMSCALMANSPSFSILQINVTSSKYSNTKSRENSVIADL